MLIVAAFSSHQCCMLCSAEFSIAALLLLAIYGDITCKRPYATF